MEKSRQQPPRLQISRTRTLIHLFIIIFVFFSSHRVVGQSMAELFDALKTKEEIESFSNDPGKFIKGKLTDEAKKRLTDAAFGAEMSPEMSNLFKRVSIQHDAKTVGGACNMAAHGNASSILFDLKYQGQIMWLPRTSLKIIGSILSVQKSIGEYFKGKAEDEIKDRLTKHIDGIPIETFSDTGSKQGCNYSIVATIDYGRKVYEVVIVADCKCQALRIPLRRGSGVVEGWKLFAKGPLTLNTENSFIKANLGRVTKYNFIPACICEKDNNTADVYSGAGSSVAGNEGSSEGEKEKEKYTTKDCIELAKLIAEVEKELDHIRNMRNDIKKRAGGKGFTDLERDELANLDARYNSRANEMSGYLMSYNKFCSPKPKEEFNTDFFSPLARAYFVNALSRFTDGGQYGGLTKERKEKNDKIIENAEKAEKELNKKKKEKSKASKDQKVGSSWSPPKGTTRIAAIGTVRKEKVMITSRGSIGGTVTLEDEEGEELATAVPDEEGRFNIDFGAIGMTVASTLILRRFDSNGKEVTSTPVEYLPETPSEVAGPPEVTQPEIPYLENNQINELGGSNLGEGTEVIITNEQGEDILQETLSTTTNSAMYYLDGPVGQAEVRVRNEFGNSEPIEIGIYEFSVRAGKMALIRNEKTSLTGFYKGLPVGTRIVFTNMSENVTIKPDGKAKTSGNEVTFMVKEKGREVKLNLKARKAGGWSISYRLEFPE